MGEDARVAVRSVRREAIEKLKDREKKKESPRTSSSAGRSGSRRRRTPT